MKNKILKIIVLFIILANVAIIIIYENKNNKLLTNVDNMEDIFFHNIFNNLEYSLIDNIIVFDDEGREQKFSTILESYPKIVVYINSLSCEFCIRNELDIIKRCLGEIKQNDIIFLSGNTNMRTIKLMKKKYALENPIFNVIMNQNLPNFLANSTVPVIFVINEQQKIIYPFLSNKNLPHISIKYYNQLHNYFGAKYRMLNDEKRGIHFMNSIINIGAIKTGSDTILNIWYKNKMNEPLIISNISSSCGCTVVDWNKAPLAPQDSANIQIHYKSDNIGFFNKAILIKSNAPNNPIKLLIEGKGI